MPFIHNWLAVKRLTQILQYRPVIRVEHVLKPCIKQLSVLKYHLFYLQLVTNMTILSLY
jgi:hypothetical protein